MFAMTQAAGEFLSGVLERAELPEDAAIRFEIQGNSLISKVDKPRPGDAIFDHDGKKVLVMDDRVSQLLAESRLEVQPSPEGAKLVIVE